MPTFFEVLHSYQGVRDGRQLGPWRAGDPVAVDAADLVWLARDSPGLFDLTRPLTAEQAGVLAGEAERRRADADRAQRDRQAAVREHVRKWGGAWCPGAAGVQPHQVVDDLAAIPDGTGWRVGCRSCLSRGGDGGR